MTSEQGSTYADDSVDLDDGEVPARSSDRWSVDEVLAVVLLVAATLRIVAAIAAQFPFYSLVSNESTTQRIGYVLVGADFADGQGVLLLLFIMGLAWWASTRRSERPEAAVVEEADLHRHRAHRALTWLWVLFGVTAVGAMTVIAGTFLYYGAATPVDEGFANGSSESTVTLAHVIGTGGFEVAYLIAAMGGLWVTLRLRASLWVDGGEG